jgi:MbtH protein
MATDPEADDRTYHVVVNDEEQYSIWLDGKDVPAGWRMVGKSGTKPECLAYVEEVWTDMRPKSLRLAMESKAPDRRTDDVG